MALDLTWILSAKDGASAVFDKVRQAGTGAAGGIENAFSGVLTKFNLVSGAIGTLATVAGGYIFEKMVKSAVDWDLSVGKLAQTLGMTTAQASVYSVACERAGVDQGTAESAALRLAKTLGTNEDVFHRLGVATRDNNGNLRNTAELMPEVNQKLSELKAGTDRNVAAMEIYGRSWNDVRALLKLTPAAMDEAKKKAEELHLVVGDEGVKQAKKYKENLNDINLVGKSLSIQFGNVLLPWLVKIGAWLGGAGPQLANAFSIALQFLGKTAYSVGSTLAIMVSNGVSAAKVLYNVFTGNFRAAGDELKVAWNANKAYLGDMAKTWTDWSAKPPTSKASTGDLYTDQAPQQAAATQKTKDHLAERLRLWKQNAKDILDVERDRVKELIDIEKKHIEEFKKQLDERITSLDKFRSAYTAVLDSIAARNKTLQDEQDTQKYSGEDSTSRYHRQRLELTTAEQGIDDNVGFTPETIAKKLKGYDDLITRAKAMRDSVLAGQVDLVSKEQAESDFLQTKQKLEEKIKLIGDEQVQRQTLGAEKLAETIKLMENGLSIQEKHLLSIEQMLKNIPNITEKELRIKVTGLQDLYRIATLTNSSSTDSADAENDAALSNFGGGKASGGYVKPHTTYRVNEDGTEYLTMGNRGGYITPAGKTPGGSVSIGDVHISLPNVTNQTASDDLARSLIPALKKYMGRSL